MSLLDKIDILITPNAYKKGKLFAALPSPTFGGELAGDGDFADGSTAWTLNPGWSIGGNSARYDGNALGTSISQNIIGVTGGNRYTVTFEVTQNTGDQNNTVSLGSTTLTNSTHLPLGCNTFTGVAGFGTALNIYGNSGELLIIRNLTVKQELTGIADLDFTRASAATRVDPLGFINYAGVLPGVEQVTNGNFQQIGPEQVSNGDFDQIGPEEVSNGNFDQIGPELVTNGDFATDSDWVLNTGWSIADNKAIVTNAPNLYQRLTQSSLSFTLNLIYKISVTCSEYSSGYVYLRKPRGEESDTSLRIDSIGTFVFTVKALTELSEFALAIGAIGTDLKIDNVSVKEVGQDWTVTGTDSTHYVEFLSTGARFVSDTTSPVLELKQNAITSGKQYVLTCNVAYTGAGQLRVNVGSNLTAFTEGANTRYFTASSSTMSFLRENANVDALLSNVSVKEVGQDWTFGNGWGMGDDKANYDATVTGTELRQLMSSIASGKTVKIQFDILDVEAAKDAYFKLDCSGAPESVFPYTKFSAGTYTYYHTITSGLDRLTFTALNSSTGGYFSIDNVSVKEVFQGWTIATSPELSLGSVTFTSNGQNLFQAWTEETGTTYYIQLEGTGPVRLRTGFAGIPGQMIEVTLPDIITVNTDADTNRIQIYGSSSGTAVLTNVSVVEGGEIDIPRIDYTGGGCPHILAEPQRTNNIQYSEDFTQSYWRKDKVTVTANSIISPSGQLDASLIQETVYTGGIPSFDLLSSITLGTGSHTFTFYVKNNNGRYLGISFGSNAQRVRTNFDFTTNTFKTLIFNGTTTGSASFTTLGDYYRISITATFPSSTVADTVIMPLATDTYPFYAFQDSDNRSFYLWGAQLEEGSYATSYIPTEGTTATRAIEKYESAEDISGLIGQTEGTFFIELSKPVLEPDNYYLISLNNAASNSDVNSVTIGFNNVSDDFYIRLRANASNIFTDNTTASLANTFYKIAIAYKSGQSLIYIDGSPITPNGGNLSNAFAFTATLDNLSFDYNGNGVLPFYGNVRQLQVYDTALTDEELTLLTIPPNSTYSTYAEMANALNYTLQ